MLPWFCRPIGFAVKLRGKAGRRQAVRGAATWEGTIEQSARLRCQCKQQSAPVQGRRPPTKAGSVPNSAPVCKHLVVVGAQRRLGQPRQLQLRGAAHATHSALAGHAQHAAQQGTAAARPCHNEGFQAQPPNIEVSRRCRFKQACTRTTTDREKHDVPRAAQLVPVHVAQEAAQVRHAPVDAWAQAEGG